MKSDKGESGELAEFRKAARSASCHYADDSTREWGLANKQVLRCMALYRNHPEHRSAFESIARGELWAREAERKFAAIRSEEEVTTLCL